MSQDLSKIVFQTKRRKGGREGGRKEGREEGRKGEKEREGGREEEREREREKIECNGQIFLRLTFTRTIRTIMF